MTIAIILLDYHLVLHLFKINVHFLQNTCTIVNQRHSIFDVTHTFYVLYMYTGMLILCVHDCFQEYIPAVYRNVGMMQYRYMI